MNFSVRTRIGFVVHLVLLLALAGLLFLAGNNSVGLFDRDEPWYAEISREMVRSGDWVVPKFLGVVFVGKPVFCFWCFAASIRLFGDTTFAVRLPSAVAMILTMLVVTLFVARYAGRKRAIWSALILCTSVISIVTAKTCLTDSILLLWITISQLALYAIYRHRGGWLAVLGLWVAIGLAVLSKGPVVIGIQAGTLVALLLLDVGARWNSLQAWRGAISWWPRTKPWFGIFIAAAVVWPWARLVQQRAPGFLVTTWVHSMYGPIVNSSLEGHRGPPGYFLLLIWPMFLPWSLFLPPAVLKGWSNRRLAPIRFALAAVIGPWVVIELVKQKLPHYLLPLIPPLAFLTADLLVRCARGQYPRLLRPGDRFGLVAWALVATMAGFIPFIGALPPIRSHELPWVAMWILAFGMTVYAGVVVFFFWRRKIAGGVSAMGIGMAVGTIFLFTCILPQLSFMRLSEQCGQLLVAHRKPNSGTDVATLIAKPHGGREMGYKEPSLAYCLDGRLRVLDATVLNKPTDRWPRWLVMTQEIWDGVPGSARSRLEPIGTLRGLNYGGGGRMTCVIIARTKTESQR